MSRTTPIVIQLKKRTTPGSNGVGALVEDDVVGAPAPPGEEREKDADSSSSDASE
ncbi:unnamed protein product, partial [Polarella glacialis]